MSDVLWRRLKYMLTPQWDIYKAIAPQGYKKSVLEVGFGTGFGTIQLALSASNVHGIESDANAYRFAQAVYLAVPNVIFSHADIMELYPQPLYDMAVMVEVLEHIEDWQTALKNVRGLLLDGGKLYLTARNANADQRRNHLHEREWTAQELAYNLGLYFSDVKLYDHTLTNELSTDTTKDFLIAVATK